MKTPKKYVPLESAEIDQDEMSDEKLNESIEQSEDMGELKEGNDPIEIDMDEGKKIDFGSTFSPQDGDLGDESEDLGDLPRDYQNVGNRYDPTLSTGAKEQEENDELLTGIEVVDEGAAGLGYGDNDYSENEEREKEEDLE